MTSEQNDSKAADLLLEQQEEQKVHEYDGLDTGHDYDGIRELDNPLPGWWLTTLWGAIIFAVAYWFYYETTGAGPDQAQELAIEIAESDLKTAEYNKKLEASGDAPWSSDEGLLKLTSDTTVLASGKALFETNCAACHKADGSGLIGPNLTDKMWIHGGSPKSIFKTISVGVLAKGMPAWKDQLGAKGVSELVGYILTMRNKNLPGKAAEGKPYAGK